MDRLLCVPPLLSLIVSILLRSQYLPEYHSPSILTMQELSETVHIYGATDGPPGLRRHCVRAIDSRSATGSKGSPYRVPTQSIVFEGTVRECTIKQFLCPVQIFIDDGCWCIVASFGSSCIIVRYSIGVTCVDL